MNTHKTYRIALCCIILISGCTSNMDYPPDTTIITTAFRCESGPEVPADYYSRLNVTSYPKLDNNWVATLGAAKLGVFAGNRVSGTQPEGFPVNTGVDPTAISERIMLRTWAYMADDVLFPRPSNLLYEGSPGPPLYDADQLTVTTDCRTYELIGLNDILHRFIDGVLPGPWQAEGSVVWDKDYTPRTRQYTPQGITAAGVPLTPLILRWEEVQEALGGKPIEHAFHWFGMEICNGGVFVWPARRTDCVSEPDTSAPPMGAWFRLRSDYATEGLTPQARVVIEALKTYGMIYGDGGGQGVAVETAPCPDNNDDLTLCWKDASLAELRAIPLSAFEAVDVEYARKWPSTGVSDPGYWLIKNID